MQYSNSMWGIVGRLGYGKQGIKLKALFGILSVNICKLSSYAVNKGCIQSLDWIPSSASIELKI